MCTHRILLKDSERGRNEDEWKMDCKLSQLIYLPFSFLISLLFCLHPFWNPRPRARTHTHTTGARYSRFRWIPPFLTPFDSSTVTIPIIFFCSSTNAFLNKKWIHKISYTQSGPSRHTRNYTSARFHFSRLASLTLHKWILLWMQGK